MLKLDTVLITGGSSLLATNWAKLIRDEYQVILVLHKRIIKIEGCKTLIADLSCEQSIINLIKQTKCDLIIHTAALTDIEYCEKFPNEAVSVNVDITTNISKACKRSDVKLVHISTDQLFSGGRSFIKENEIPSALNVYGKTKQLAEEGVKNSGCNSLIIRTNFYGWGPSYRKSFSDWIISSLREEKKITLFEDVFYTPILIDTLVEIVHELLNAEETGIFNVVGNDRISKYQFGLKVADIFSLSANVIRGSLLERPNLVVRPLDMSLSNAKVNKVLLGCTKGVENDLISLRETKIRK